METKHPFFKGIYRLPDAALILGIPLPKLRRWLKTDFSDMNSVCEGANPYGVGTSGICGESHDKYINFFSLIELFTVFQLRKGGVSFKEIRAVREGLKQDHNTTHPFAMKGLLSDGKKMTRQQSDGESLLLNEPGQRAFYGFLKAFYERLDFSEASDLAIRYYPLGRDSSIVVDPRVSFGRPVIKGTAITTETIRTHFTGGDQPKSIAVDFEITEIQVDDALEFENSLAA